MSDVVTWTPKGAKGRLYVHQARAGRLKGNRWWGARYMGARVLETTDYDEANLRALAEERLAKAKVIVMRVHERTGEVEALVRRRR